MPRILHRLKRGFVPNDIGSSLIAWFDAADLNTIVLNGANVSQWSDKSGQGNHVVQATATKQPPYQGITSTITTPYLNFTGPQNLQATLKAAPGNLAPHTIFVAGKGISSTNGVFMFYSGTSLPNQNSSMGTTSYNRGGYAWWFGGYGQDETYGGGTSDNLPHVFTKTYDGVKINGYFNGGFVFTTSVAYNLTFANIGVGCQTVSGNSPLTGYVQEMLICNAAVSDLTRQKIEGYLAWKWGLQNKLASTHTYKFVSPMAIY